MAGAPRKPTPADAAEIRRKGVTTGFLDAIDPRPQPTVNQGARLVPRAYADAVLRNQLHKVETAGEGTRNDTLNQAAFELRPYILGGAFDELYVIDELTVAARIAGLDEWEIEPTIRSGFAGAEAKNLPPIGIDLSQSPSAPSESRSETGWRTENDVWGEFPPVDAGEWLWGDDDPPKILWGMDQDILWAEGEALMIAGNMGLGKTTLAGNLIRAQLGLQDEVLGLPVLPIERILYLAMDRPRQIRRSMRRQFAENELDKVKGRLFIRQGPPVADLAVQPKLLAEMAKAVDANVVYLDSLKDAVIGLSSDEVGAAYNRARQYLLAQEIDICELHHNRKPGKDSGTSIGEVYGSTWLTSGAGSVIMLFGEPGDPIVRFHHRKMPADEVGPYRLYHDPDNGVITVNQSIDLVVLTQNAGPEGLTARAAAEAMYEKNNPSPAEVKKAIRQLDKLVKQGELIRMDGQRGGFGGSTATAWFVAGSSNEERL